MTRPETFSEERSRAILARAADLDRVLNGRLTPEELKDAAAAAGISAAALDAALAEAHGEELQERVMRDAAETAGAHRRAALALLVVAAIGAAIGYAPGLQVADYQVFVDPDGDAARTALLLAGVCGLFAIVADSGENAHHRFQLGNLAAWGGFMIGGLLGFSADWEFNIGIIGLLGAAGCAVGGSAIIWAKQRWTAIRNVFTTPARVS